MHTSSTLGDSKQKRVLAPAGHWHMPLDGHGLVYFDEVSKNTSSGIRWSLLVSMLCACLGLGSGCAIHYCDRQTGTEHVWGFGHMRMKSAPVAEGVDSVVSGTSIAGVGLGAGREDYYLTAGWDYRRRIVIGTNAAFGLEWPTADFFNVHVSTNFPYLLPGQGYWRKTNQ